MNRRLFVIIALLTSFSTVSIWGAAAQGPQPVDSPTPTLAIGETPRSTPPSSLATTQIQQNALYAHSDSDLWIIDPNTQTSTYIGPINYTTTDIAFLENSLYGVTYTDFLSLDPTTGNATVIGPTGYTDVTALTIGSDSTAYGADLSGAFITINKTTGAGSLVGYFGAGLSPAGDLAFREDGVLFATVNRSGYSNTWLAVVNRANGAATLVGDMGFQDVWGLSFKDGVLYGVTAQGEILQINTSTGNGTLIYATSVSFWGLTTSGNAPTVNWIRPVGNGQVYQAACGEVVDLEVSATDDVSGVSDVEFYRWDAVNQVMILITMDYSPPYQASLNVCDLNIGWNEVIAEAYDIAGNGASEYIWIDRVETYSISGYVRDSNNSPIAGVIMSAGPVTDEQTDINGFYTISGLPAGPYTVTPSKAGYTFNPTSLSVTVPPNATGKNFTGTPTTPPPDPNWDAWPQSGNAPLTVSFHIVNTSNITSCSWDYGDGQTGSSCAAYHNHTYNIAGSYTVTLTVSGPGGSDTMTRSDYINVSSPPLPTVAFSTATYTVNEGAGTATIIVNLSGPSGQTVTVDYATNDGTATAGSDYTATSGTLTFNPGQTSNTFMVPILNDALDESDETVNLTLSNPFNATLGDPANATLVIVDNDYDTVPPTVNWISPVGNGQVYQVASGTVGLEVSATDNDSGVNRVEFWWFDAVNNQDIHLGTDYSAPYQSSVNVSDLNMGLNDIYADVSDNAGNYDVKDIWIDRVSSPPPDSRPPVLLVHGWMGLSKNQERCGVGFGRYSATNNTFQAMAGWFVQEGFDVWIAHLDSGPYSTPLIEDNARCLQKQVISVTRETQQGVILVGHSMGGLVSRACLSLADCRSRVTALYTLGSPHAGIKGLSLAFRLIPLSVWCVTQRAMCQFSAEYMALFGQMNPNVSGLTYQFIGGTKTDKLPGPILLVTDGPNDSLVGSASATGRSFPFNIKVIRGPEAGRYWTYETHTSSLGKPSYFDAYPSGQQYSQAFRCLMWLMKGGAQPECTKITSASASASETSQAVFSVTTADRSGTITSGQTVTHTLVVDTSAHSVFQLSWLIGTLSFTLTQPNGQVITPVYAVANSQVVTYTTGIGSPETPPYAAYAFTSTLPGVYTMTIGAGNVGAGTNYVAFAALETTRLFTITSNATWYHVGQTAIFTGTLRGPTGGIAGATVQGQLLRADGATTTLSFTHLGSGVYRASTVIPDVTGYVQATFVAEGNDGGIAFSRQVDDLLGIVPHRVQLTGSYADRAEDTDADGFQDTLALDVGVTATSVGTYTLAADLVRSGQLVAHVVDYRVLTPGVQTVTMRFDGGEIRRSKINGPYTVTNVYVIDLDAGGLPAVSATNVWTTAAYKWTSFGYDRIYLPLILRN